MSSAGHVLDMIIRNRNNEALRKETRNRYKKVKDAYLKHTYKHIRYVDKNKLTSEELKELKIKIRRKIIRERQIAATKSVVVSLIILFLLIILISKII